MDEGLERGNKNQQSRLTGKLKLRDMFPWLRSHSFGISIFRLRPASSIQLLYMRLSNPAAHTFLQPSIFQALFTFLAVAEGKTGSLWDRGGR